MCKAHHHAVGKRGEPDPVVGKGVWETEPESITCNTSHRPSIPSSNHDAAGLIQSAVRPYTLHTSTATKVLTELRIVDRYTRSSSLHDQVNRIEIRLCRQA